MTSVNKMIVIGRLGKDVELRYTNTGKAVANFSVATSMKGTGADGYGKEETEWHRIVVWDKQAESCAQYLSKGKLVYVEGRLATRKYTDKQGHSQSSTEIIAHTIQFLSPKDEASQADHNPIQNDNPMGVYDDVPF